jgi:Tfp pilus assembly protein PilX
MKIAPKRKLLVRGGVLVTALIFALVISLFAVGVALVSSSHLDRATVESDYATAIQLADAGVNFELRWLSNDTSTASARAHQSLPQAGQLSAYTGTVPNIPGGGSFTVSVSNTDGSGPWSPPNHVLIRSTGTINGISRTVEVTGRSRGLFGEYAIFSIDEAKMGGSKAFVIGNMGTNGPVSFSGGNPEGNIQGELTFNGYPANGNLSGEMRGSNVWWYPNPVQWPTVSEIAESLFVGGLTYLKNNNDNDRVKSFLASDTESLLSNAITMSIGTGSLEKRQFNSFAPSRNLQDRPGGNRYQNGSEGLYGNKVIIFPPGDYYFSGVKMSNGTGEAILIDNASGMVRIWINGGNAKDSLDLPVLFTSSDKNKFRLYYNNCSEISIGGNSKFYGSIYSHVDGCQSSVKLHGNSQILGSVIFEDIWLTGNSDIIFPNDGGGEADSDYALWYGFMNTWREVNPAGGSVFPDGTRR